MDDAAFLAQCKKHGLRATAAALGLSYSVTRKRAMALGYNNERQEALQRWQQPEIRAEFARLWRQGVSKSRMARHFGVSDVTIAKVRVKLGLRPRMGGAIMSERTKRQMKSIRQLLRNAEKPLCMREIIGRLNQPAREIRAVVWQMRGYGLIAASGTTTKNMTYTLKEKSNAQSENASGHRQ